TTGRVVLAVAALHRSDRSRHRVAASAADDGGTHNGPHDVADPHDEAAQEEAAEAAPRSAAWGRRLVPARSELEALLRGQERDIALDRLRYRRASLPERESIRERQARAADLTARANVIRTDRDVALAEERKLDDEAQGLTAKAKQVDSKLYSGTVSSPR